MSPPHLPFVITGLYRLVKPKVPLITVSKSPDEAEKARQRLELSIDGQPTQTTSLTAGDKSTLRRYALLKRDYTPVESGPFLAPNVAALSLSKHTDDTVFLIVCLDEHYTDKYGVDFIVVREYHQFRVPTDIVSDINGVQFQRKSLKKVKLLNRFKCSISKL